MGDPFPTAWVVDVRDGQDWLRVCQDVVGTLVSPHT